MIKEKSSAQSLKLQKCQPRKKTKSYGGEWDDSVQQDVQPNSQHPPRDIWGRGAMIVNFMCQPDGITGCPNIWLSIISGCVCEADSEDISIWTDTEGSRLPSSVWMGIISSSEILERKKGGGRGICALALSLGHFICLLSWNIDLSSGLLVLRPWSQNCCLHHLLSRSQAFKWPSQAFPGLQLEDNPPYDFLSSIITWAIP